MGPAVNPRAVSLNRSTRANIHAVAEAQGAQTPHPTVRDTFSDRDCGTWRAASWCKTRHPGACTRIRQQHRSSLICWHALLSQNSLRQRHNRFYRCHLHPLTPTGKAVADVTVVILDRPRHADIIQEIRDTGCRIKLISDGDVAAAIEVAKAGAAADLLLGIGGTPEGESFGRFGRTSFLEATSVDALHFMLWQSPEELCSVGEGHVEHACALIVPSTRFFTSLSMLL